MHELLTADGLRVRPVSVPNVFNISWHRVIVGLPLAVISPLVAL